MVATVATGLVPEDPGRRLTELLRSHPEVSSAIRLRIALDVVADLIRAGARQIEPRRPSSRLQLDGVFVATNGVAHLPAGGDDSGALELVSEILGSGGAGLRLLEAMNAGGGARVKGLDALLATLMRKAANAVATHHEVRRAFELDAPSQDGREPSGPVAIDPFVVAAQRLAARVAAPVPEDRQAAAWRSLAQEAVSQRRRTPGAIDATSRPAAARPVSPAQPREPTAQAPSFTWATPAPSPPPRWAEPFPARVARRAAVILVAAVDLERRCLGAAIRDAGHRVVELNDLDAAIAAATAQPPLAIVADTDVRGRSGEELTRRVRAQAGPVAATPILQLVSATSTRVMKTTFATSADARAMKPLRPEDLVAELGKLLVMGPRLRIAREALPTLEGSSDTILRGDLGTVPIEGLLTMLEIERRTGFVRISTPRGTVGIELASGAVARGSFQGEMVPAIEAMRRLAGVDDGAFSFHALPPRVAPPDAQPLHVLLRASLKMVRRSG